MRAALALPLILGAGAALAQDAPVGEDWDILRDGRKKSTIAYVTTTAGLIIGTRCVKNSFSAILIGLPEATRSTKTRSLRLIFRDEEQQEWRWNVTTDRTSVVADFPAPFARELRKGGRLQIVVPDGAGAGRNLRYDLTLPASGSAIDETLTECGRPLEDVRDQQLSAIGEDGLQVDMTWERQVRPTYPIGSNYADGFAVASCVANPDGRMHDCVIETEHPSDGRFGQAVLRSIPDGRIAFTGDQPTTPRMVSFRVNFIMQ